mgnify:CR=1 FL=1
MPNYIKAILTGWLLSLAVIAQGGHATIKRVNHARKNKHTTAIISLLHRTPVWWTILGVALLIFMVVMVATLWPRSITISYASEKTCVYQPTVLPGLLRTHGSSYRLEADQVINLGELPLMAMSMCVIPTQAPTQGITTAQLSFSGSFLQKSYTIKTPHIPSVSRVLAASPVPLSKPLGVTLSQKDAIYTYKLRIDSQKAPCVAQDAQLLCDIHKLKLKQGARYMAAIERYFAGKKTAVVSSQTIQTLEATTIVSSSITEGETVFGKPTSLELLTDKDIMNADLRLYRLHDGKRELVQSQTTFKDKRIVLTWQGELPRLSGYILEAFTVTGKDGSGLDGDYRLAFRLSGGPQVVKVSVGTYNVPLGSMATITFDQPLLERQDLSKALALTGGAAIVSAKGNQVTVSFAGVPRCSDVTISVNDKLESRFGITGGSAWSYQTRTTCQVQEIIGTSVKGRAIVAYKFGNGSKKIIYIGAIHGNELSTRTLLHRWIDELEANYQTIPTDVTAIVIPSLNPDGVATQKRTNANNIDLNRNFATSDWKSDITTTGNEPFPGGGGKSAMSEPESRAIAQFIGSAKPQLVLSYHSIGGLIAANQTGNSRTKAAAYASLSGYRNTTGVSDTFEYGISGTADDYYGQILGVPSVLIELGSHSDPQVSRNLKPMWAMLK